mgnify:CR=1 FL=1
MTNNQYNMTDEKWKVTEDLIAKYKIDYGLLAEVLGISEGCFSEKRRKLRYSKFTDAQKEKITNYLVCMGKVILGELEK